MTIYLKSHKDQIKRLLNPNQKVKNKIKPIHKLNLQNRKNYSHHKKSHPKTIIIKPKNTIKVINKVIAE